MLITPSRGPHEKFNHWRAHLKPTQTDRQYHLDNTIPHAREGCHWVFGSNEAGRHGLGAAKVAKVNFGAEYGVGRGPTGKAYAIPTKDRHLAILPLDIVKQNIGEFLAYASANPKTRFFVTRIGCGLAKNEDDEIGPLFADAPANCILPVEWKCYVSQAGITPQNALNEQETCAA